MSLLRAHAKPAECRLFVSSMPSATRRLPSITCRCRRLVPARTRYVDQAPAAGEGDGDRGHVTPVHKAAMRIVDGHVLIEAGPAGLVDLDHAIAIFANHSQPTSGAIGTRPGEHRDAWLT